jgi:Kef-type K+ transport system membrane component KefB
VEPALNILLVGIVIVLAVLIKAGAERVRLPAVVGFIALGFAIRLGDMEWGVLNAQSEEVFSFLATLGLVTLLFHIGLESHLEKLLSQLSRASLLGMSGIVVSGVTGFAAAYWLLNLGWVTSVVVGTALTATSVGIPSGVWEEAGKVGCEEGQLFLDVAELDDIAGVTLMALLLAMLPQWTGGASDASGVALPKTLGLVAVKLVAFGLFCVLFARYGERHVTRFFTRIQSSPERMLAVAGVGIVIAAAAGLLGFSVAIGAFFAGLVFSRDPDSVRIDASFNAVYALFSPLFFVGIGLELEPTTVGPAIVPAAVILLAAILGKFVGTAGPALATEPGPAAAVIGVSMVPRAEITLVIARHSRDAGALPPHVFSAMVLVSAATCLLGTVTLFPMIPRGIGNAEDGDGKDEAS